MLPHALTQMTRSANVQMLSLFAEQVDALLRRVSGECGDRDRGHANQPLERRMQRLSVAGERGVHFGSTLSPIATIGAGFSESKRPLPPPIRHPERSDGTSRNGGCESDAPFRWTLWPAVRRRKMRAPRPQERVCEHVAVVHQRLC